MLLDLRALKSLNNIEKIHPRMMVATFNCYPSSTIISCYSPTIAIDEKDLDTFYNELSSLVPSIPKHNVLIIGGDINAQIGKNENSKFSLHSSSNRNEEHLTDFSLENGLACLNTRFQKRKRKLWTYTYANKANVQIDSWIRIGLILCFELWGILLFLDHRIDARKIRLNLGRNTTQTTKTTHYDWSLLNNRDISDKYTITQKSKFDALHKISETLTQNDEYKNFVDAHMEAVAECIATKKA